MIEQIQQAAKNAVELEQVSEGVYKVKTEATLLNGNSITIFLEQRENKWYLSDAKETLKYMNDLYELKSADVKMCISNVIKLYGFSISGGMLLAPIDEPENFMDKLFDYIMCVGQLANMFAFFDKP